MEGSQLVNTFDKIQKVSAGMGIDIGIAAVCIEFKVSTVALNTEAKNSKTDYKNYSDPECELFADFE
jgi:hypothetical protein